MTNAIECDFRSVSVGDLFSAKIDYPHNNRNYTLRKLSARKAQIVEGDRQGEKVNVNPNTWCQLA